MKSIKPYSTADIINGRQCMEILHIMRDIRALLEQGVSESNFGLSSYLQPQPNGGYKTVSCYTLTKKGCLILASGYNAKLREKIIDRLEELERTHITGGFRVPQSYAEALRQLADTVEQHSIQKMPLQRHNTIPNPIKSIESTTIPTAYPCRVSTLARILQEYGIVIGRNQLFAWLRENGYLHTHGEDYNLPTPKAEQMKLFEVKHTIIDKSDGNPAITSTVRVAAAGQLYFMQQILGDKVS